MTGARWAGWAVVVATVIGAAVRLYGLDTRPIHHDEAVNWFLSYGVVHSGLYDYDPSNYHGPLHFHVGAWVQRWIGEGLTHLRLPTALVGIGMIPMPWLLRKRLGHAGAAGAAGLIALSPTLVYYARDAIHETWLVAFTLLGAAGIVRWWDAPDATAARHAALLTGFAVGGAVSTKETVIITVASAVASGFVAAWVAGVRQVGVPWKDLTWLTLAALVVITPFYTSFGQHPQDLIDLASTLQVWSARGAEGAGHDKPVAYFIELLVRYEALSVALACLGAAWSVRTRNPWGLATTVWAVTQLAVYSAIPYKTPWLIANMSLPLAMLGGVGVTAITQAPSRWRWLAVACLAPLALKATTETRRLGWIDHDRTEEPLVYVQTHRELTQLMQLAIGLGADTPIKVRSFTDAHYPMNWYLWTHDLSEESLDPLPTDANADLVLVDAVNEHVLISVLSGDYLRREVQFRNGLVFVAFLDATYADSVLHDPAWTHADITRDATP